MSWKAVIKKWYVILLCAILCAGGLYFEKSRVNTVIPQTGNMTYVRVVRFDTVPVLIGYQTSTEINMMNLSKSWPYLSDLEKQLETEFSMPKLNAKWAKLTGSQKISWVAGHFRIQYLAPGLYELIVQFQKDDLKDAEYIAENSMRMLDAYEKHFIAISEEVTKDTKISRVKEFENVDTSEPVTKESIEKKYAIIGFVLGALVGVVIIMTWDARKYLIKH